MKQLLISVRDAKADFFSPPMLVRTRGEAFRSFTDAVNTEGAAFHRHAEDYALYLLGELDILTGVISPQAVPLMLITGMDVLREAGAPLKAVV